ncbi:MAG: HAD family hydrolase [Pseudomonadota bacterium]
MTALLEGEPVETVLLDMDGTLLDLHFDNHFWSEYLPQSYAERRGLTVEQARSELAPRFEAVLGTLDWYCLDYWRGELGLDLVALKEDVAHRIGWLPGVEAALDALGRLGLRRVVATNAHGASLELKCRVTGLADHVEAIHTSHTFGMAKEDEAFWFRLAEVEPFDPASTLLVDDNPAVLRAGLAHGIRHTRLIRQPDTRRPAAPDVAGLTGVHGLGDVVEAVRAETGAGAIGIE